LNTLTNKSSVDPLCLISNNQIACCCLDGSINIWNLNNSTIIKSFKAHDDWIPYLLFVDQSKFISCSGSNDKKIKIWNSETFECIKVLEGHSSTIWYLDLTSDGDLLSCSEDESVKLWKIETGEMLKSIKFDHGVNCVKTLNEDLIAVSLENGEIEIYDLNKNEKIKTIKDSSFVNRLNLLPNGCLLSGSEDGYIKSWKIFD